MGLFRRRQESSHSAEPTSVTEEGTEAGSVVAPVAPEPPTVEDMTAAEVLAVVRYRLAEESYIAHMPEPPADVTPFAPGIVRHLVLDLPDSVTTTPAAVLEGKAPLESLREAAETNTRAVLEEPWESQLAGEGPGGAVHVVFGESLFTATMALYLPEVVARIVPDADLSRGIVFAVPMRHQLALHLPNDTDSLRAVLPTFMRFAGHGYDEGAGPVSPELYHWENGTVTALTSPDASGRVTVTPTGALRDLLGDTSH